MFKYKVLAKCYRNDRGICQEGEIIETSKAIEPMPSYFKLISFPEGYNPNVPTNVPTVSDEDLKKINNEINEAALKKAEEDKAELLAEIEKLKIQLSSQNNADNSDEIAEEILNKLKELLSNEKITAQDLAKDFTKEELQSINKHFHLGVAYNKKEIEYCKAILEKKNVIFTSLSF
jgi:CRISPR/Cas system CSM-associated protein Csm2 small subunit